MNPTLSQVSRLPACKMVSTRVLRRLPVMVIPVAITRRPGAFLREDASYAQEVGALIMLAVTPVAYMFAEGWADSGAKTVDSGE